MPKHRAWRRGGSARRACLLLATTAATLAMAAATVYAATRGTSLIGTAAASSASCKAAGGGYGCARPADRPGPPGSAAAELAAARQRAATPPATRHRRASPRRPAPSPRPSAAATAADAVLALINQARAQAGLPAYTVTSGLQLSSGRHNQLMADGCGLSHQCPGEPSLGDRETAAGVHWTEVGENIGDGGPMADTSAAITQMALTLTQEMLNEKPPDDGHRQNLLSSAFTHVGITIAWSGGTVWMTQDFSN